ncbi:MAG: HAMP domain-containing histidine kinase [Thermoproteota archaeon]|nr:HAMP domain-containing histidine kinase [Thermoproteota archaeon]
MVRDINISTLLKLTHDLFGSLIISKHTLLGVLAIDTNLITELQAGIRTPSRECSYRLCLYPGGHIVFRYWNTKSLPLLGGVGGGTLAGRRKRYLKSAAQQKTDIIYDVGNVVNAVIRFASTSKIKIDACVDYTRPSLAIDIELLKKYFQRAKRRGVRLRYVTEITKDNIQYCKELMKMVDDLRHLDGIRGNFYLSEKEYLAPAAKHKKGKPASQIIRSNVKEILIHQQYVFNSFWNRATPAQQKFIEIEQGKVHYETKILDTQDEIVNQVIHLAETSTGLSIVSGSGGMQLIYNNFFDSYKKVLRKGNGIKWIINVNKGNVGLVKTFIGLGIQIKHIKNMPPMNFVVGDKELNATIEKMDGGKMVQSLLTSNEPVYVEHFNSLFEELWKNGIDARDRTKDIEMGVDLADIEVIQNSSVARELYLNIVNSAIDEIMLIFPTTNAFLRQEKLGVVKLLIQKAKENEEKQKRNLKIRMLLPTNKSIAQKAQNLKQHVNIDVRFIEQPSETKATFLVVDRKVSLVMEIKDDSKQTFDEAIGLSTYSTSKAGVLSFVSIFESFWIQTQLYQQVKEANKDLELAIDQLKAHDEMQKEFINIAAHELRNPIQPILGLSEALLSRKKEERSDEDKFLIGTIIRNAKKLKRVAENLLDISRIESHSLLLNKEIFNINEIISGTVGDYTSYIEKGSTSTSIVGSNLKLTYKPSVEDIFVEADRYRLVQVISNLLNNAITFTKDNGTIDVRIMNNGTIEDNHQQLVVVTIKDSGSGIAPEMLPRLFSKFATKSDLGTGLGLFISKSIVEAHGGKIWAQNNVDQKGATFAFSLPTYASK